MGTHPHIPRSPGMTTPRAPHPIHTPTHADCGGCLFPPSLPEPAATPAPQRTPTHPARARARFRRSGQPQPLSPTRGLPSVHRLQRVRTPCPHTHTRSHCRAAFMPGGFKASRRGSPSLPRAACGHFPGFDWRGIPLPLPTKPRPRKGITPLIPARIAHRRHLHCPRPAHRAPPALREPSPSCGGLNPCLSSPCHLPPLNYYPILTKRCGLRPQCLIGLDNGVGFAHVFI